jgi:hypothetical protein
MAVSLEAQRRTVKTIVTEWTGRGRNSGGRAAALEDRPAPEAGLREPGRKTKWLLQQANIW